MGNLGNTFAEKATTPSPSDTHTSDKATTQQPEHAIAYADALAEHEATVRQRLAIADHKPFAGKARQFDTDKSEGNQRVHGGGERVPPRPATPVDVLDTLRRLHNRLRKRRILNLTSFNTPAHDTYTVPKKNARLGIARLHLRNI